MDIGFNFRGTQAYVTDGSGETYVIGDLYPVTRLGVTFGWEAHSGAGYLDRSTSVDVRLAGVNRRSNTGAPDQPRFRVDLGAPQALNLTLAIGDQTTSHRPFVAIYDDLTLLVTIVADTVTRAIGEFKDANNALHLSAAAWVTSQTSRLITMTTSILRLQICSAAADVSGTALAHMRLVTTVVPSKPYYWRRRKAG